jgi:hypothetical protein
MIGALRDRGYALNSVMSVFIATASLLSIVMMWSGPETRGREFRAAEETATVH